MAYNLEPLFNKWDSLTTMIFVARWAISTHQLFAEEKNKIISIRVEQLLVLAHIKKNDYYFKDIWISKNTLRNINSVQNTGTLAPERGKTCVWN